MEFFFVVVVDLQTLKPGATLNTSELMMPLTSSYSHSYQFC